MSLQTLKDQVPDFAKDVRLNIGSLPTVASMNAQQLWGTILAAALATRNPKVIAATRADAAPQLSQAAYQAAHTAASLMAMNNVYYRSIHLLNKEEYRNLPARLRMSGIGNPGIEKLDFELMALAVSAINGCGMCLESHEHEVMAKGATRDAVQDCLRIAAMMQSLAIALEAGEGFAQPAVAA